MIGGQSKRRLRLRRAFLYKTCIVPETYRMKTLAARTVMITEVSTSNQKRTEKKNSPETAAFIVPPTSLMTPSSTYPPPRPSNLVVANRPRDVHSKLVSSSPSTVFESLVFRFVCYLVNHRPSSSCTSWASAFSFSFLSPLHTHHIPTARHNPSA